ncbi:NepR family anti-sigma factor [Sphingomonas alpina]|nr:NepR family anti-sigma factor [Sphingomonas alpina]
MKAPPFWKGRVANATRFNARTGVPGFFASNVEQSRRSFVSCYRRGLYARRIDRISPAGIFRYARFFAGCSGGTTLSSGDESSKTPQASGTAKVQTKDRDMGAALRTVYQKTVEEDIPAEMLDLLGKLD